MSSPTASSRSSDESAGTSVRFAVSDTVSVNPNRFGEETPTLDTLVRQSVSMRVVFATAELSPVATVGGLAAAAAGLGAELRRLGVDVDLVMPDYGDVTLVDETTIRLNVPAWVGAATIRAGHHPAVGRLLLVSVPGMARPHPG